MQNFPVALSLCSQYDETQLNIRVGEALDACGWAPVRSDKILLKPNLIRAVPLACTHPLIVKAAASWLLDHEFILPSPIPPASERQGAYQKP